ncbi:MAG: hypothetical protein HY711_08830 [Candidatus Melainabacteria bacterium]|nr:hypothetical protein [Candidatus Melainabacteria bacterium]
MRMFAISYQSSHSCDCCGAPLKSPEGGPALGSYTLEIPEGDSPTEICIGNSLKITLGGKKLQIELRQRRGSNRGWAVMPMYNSGVFAKETSGWSLDSRDSNFGWYTFNFELPEYKPSFDTWWAQLDLVEVVPFSKSQTTGHHKRCHNAATLTLRLLRL